MDLLDLPALVIEEILCSLDIRSLATCCCVSREWNEYLNDHERIWRKYCENRGFVQPETEGDRTWATWKEFAFFLVVKRHNEVRNWRCFREEYLPIGENDPEYDDLYIEIVAIYFHGDRLAVATTSDIYIFDTVPEMVLRRSMNLSQDRQSSNHSLKFDDFNMLLANTDGDIESCSLHQIRSVEYENPDRGKKNLISYDFDSGSNIVVGSFLGTPIRIWKLSTGTLVQSIGDESSDMGGMIKIVSMRRPSSNKRGLHYLFLRKIDRLLMWSGTYDQNSNGEIEWSPNPDVIHTEQREMLLNYHVNILNNESNFLYYTLRSDTDRPPEIQEWDLNLRAETRKIRTPSRIQRLIAVGKKYIAYLTEEGEDIIVLEISSGKVLTTFQVRQGRLKAEFYKAEYAIVFCHQGWLDGIDLTNDKGIVLAHTWTSSMMRFVEWIPKDETPR